MRWLGTVLAGTLLVACGGGDGLQPGDVVHGVRLVRGAAEDVSLWDFCDPSLDGPGRRSCRVPVLERLRIGPGWRSDSTPTLDREWDRLEWQVRFDGQRLDLASFGTLPDSRLGDGAVVREWNITIEDLRPATHRLRAQIRGDDRRYDVTWVIEVQA
jgi:hypothetical protein